MVDRLAPAQTDRPLLDTEDEGDGDYNIWHHRKAGKRKPRSPERGLQAKTRCRPELHEGKTRGGSGSDVCLFFARGACHLGHKCNRRHRLPTEDGLDVQFDCFGRQREATEGPDQNGPGSVLLENRTIFVGDFGVDCTEDTLWQEFEVFGEIVQLRFLPQKSIAFVQYNWRSSAEFAKEAMSQQVVGEGSVVSVRWAKEDPNPKRAAQAFAERQQTVLRAVEDTTPAALAPATVPREMYADTAASPCAQQQSAVDDYLSQHGTLMRSSFPADEAYPDTDSQFELPTSAPGSVSQETVPHVALPPGWQCHLDPTYHHPYYTHLPSGRTQWEAPSDVSSDGVPPPPPKRARHQVPGESESAAELEVAKGEVRAGGPKGASEDSFSLLAGYGSDDESE